MMRPMCPLQVAPRSVLLQLLLHSRLRRHQLNRTHPGLYHPEESLDLRADQPDKVVVSDTCNSAIDVVGGVSLMK